MLTEKLQSFWSDVIGGDPLSILAFVCFAGVYLCITIYLEAHLWKRCGALSKKLFWATVLTIPLLGWMFYLAFYQAPPSQQFR